MDREGQRESESDRKRGRERERERKRERERERGGERKSKSLYRVALQRKPTPGDPVGVRDQALPGRLDFDGQASIQKDSHLQILYENLQL